jgi:UTP--glucose-1-phosphate uridylyltransferase
MAVESMNDDRWGGRLYRVTDMVEKPKQSEAPSPYVVVGRYVLEPGSLRRPRPAAGGKFS